MRLLLAFALVVIYAALPDPFPGPVDDAVVALLGTMTGIYLQIKDVNQN